MSASTKRHQVAARKARRLGSKWPFFFIDQVRDQSARLRRVLNLILRLAEDEAE